MKKILIYTMAAAVLTIAGCTKEIVKFKPTDEEIAAYGNVYMPRAEKGKDIPVVAISTTGDERSFIYNAYLGGPVDAKADINVNFTIDNARVAEYNAANGTNYKVMPEAGYTFETPTGTIPAGGRTTGDFKFTVKPGDHFTLFDTYLVPITLTGATGGGVKVKQDQTTAYLIFNVTYLPGEVPREKVLGIGEAWGSILSAGPNGSLIRRVANYDMYLYKRGTDGQYQPTPQRIAINFRDSESFFYVDENTVVVQNYPYWAGLFSFNFDGNLNLYGANPFWLGDFWNRYKLIPYKNYFLLMELSTGKMFRQPKLTDVNATKVEVGSGFTIVNYVQMLTYKNYLLALEDKTGKLWIYNLSDEGVPSNRRQVGSGWDIYDKIVVAQDVLMGIDKDGNVYSYDFNPNGFYPLK